MTKFKINEISAVDRPAQSGAKMTIMKRADDTLDEDLNKRGLLTTDKNGHSHLIYDMEEDSGHTSYSGDGDENHSHPWMRSDTGEIVIGEAQGHTHGVRNLLMSKKEIQSLPTGDGTEDGPLAKTNPAESLGSNTKESLMTDKVEKTAEELTAEMKTLQDDLAKANALATFTDADKEYYNTLNDTQKAEFIAKSADARKADVEAAQAEDAVVYKSDNGEEFRKSDDPRLITMAKQADSDRKLAKAAQEKAENAEFSKRASTELGHLPGEEAAKVAILKAVDGIQDADLKKQATELLKANNTAMAEAFKKKGSSGQGADSSAADKLDTLAKNYAKDNKVSFEKAYDTVVQDGEGKELYEATQTKGE